MHHKPGKEWKNKSVEASSVGDSPPSSSQERMQQDHGQLQTIRYHLNQSFMHKQTVKKHAYCALATKILFSRRNKILLIDFSSSRVWDPDVPASSVDKLNNKF